MTEARQLWEVYKTGRALSCEVNEHTFGWEVNEHPFGWEIRCYLNGEFYYSRVHAERSAAEEEAHQRKRDLLAIGWAERPPMPD